MHHLRCFSTGRQKNEKAFNFCFIELQYRKLKYYCVVFNIVKYSSSMKLGAKVSRLLTLPYPLDLVQLLIRR